MEFIPNYLLEKYGHLSWSELAERLYRIEEDTRRKELEDAKKEQILEIVEVGTYET